MVFTWLEFTISLAIGAVIGVISSFFIYLIVKRHAKIDYESIVEKALEISLGKEKEYEYTGIDELFGFPQIAVVGIGGAGNNMIDRLNTMGIENAKTIAINTDKEHLESIHADIKLLIGKSLTRGLGAAGYPEIGRKAVELDKERIKEVLQDKDLVFLIVGMGGGTGTGAAPVIAEIAKEQGANVVGIVTLPFRVEKARTINAEGGIENLRRVSDTVIILDNNNLLDYVSNLSIKQALSVMDKLICEAVKGITETITQPSLINLDYADLRAVMGDGSIATILLGEATGQNKVEDVVHSALTRSLLDVDYSGATGSLIHITGGPDLTMRETNEIVEALTYKLNSHADVIWGARIDNEYEGKIKVMAIMMGVQPLQMFRPKEEKISFDKQKKKLIKT